VNSVKVSEFHGFLGVPGSAHIGIRVHFGTGIVIMRHIGIQEFTWFHPFLTFFILNHHSRSLEGKYTFL